MNDKESIVSKIKALLAKTQANGCTEAESLNAASKAALMMDQHDISTMDLQDKSTFTDFVRRDIKHNVLRRNLALIVSKYCGCFVVYMGTSMKMFGRDIDILMAEWLFDSLVSHVERGLKSHMSGWHTEPSYVKNPRKNGFILGAVRRLFERIDEMMEARVQSNNAFAEKMEVNVSQSNALILSKSLEAKNAFLEQLDPSIKIKNGRKPKSIHVDSDSATHGRACADKVSFSRPISN